MKEFVSEKNTLIVYRCIIAVCVLWSVIMAVSSHTHLFFNPVPAIQYSWRHMLYHLLYIYLHNLEVSIAKNMDSEQDS